jgi:hypothetical protein
MAISNYEMLKIKILMAHTFRFISPPPPTFVFGGVQSLVPPELFPGGGGSVFGEGSMEICLQIDAEITCNITTFTDWPGVFNTEE